MQLVCYNGKSIIKDTPESKFYFGKVISKDGPEKDIRQLAQIKQSTGPKINVMLGSPGLSPPCGLEKHIINSLMEAVLYLFICIQSDRRSL